MARTENNIFRGDNAVAKMYPASSTRAYDKKKVPSQEQRIHDIFSWVSDGIVTLDEISQQQTSHTQQRNLKIKSWMESVETAIHELAQLEEDWDDEGASIINRYCILMALKFIENLECKFSKGDFDKGLCLPSVFPTKNGGVQLFWYPDNKQTSIYFLPKGNNIEVIEIEVMGKIIGSPSLRRDVTLDEALVVAENAMNDRV